MCVREKDSENRASVCVLCVCVVCVCGVCVCVCVVCCVCVFVVCVCKREREREDRGERGRVEKNFRYLVLTSNSVIDSQRPRMLVWKL